MSEREQTQGQEQGAAEGQDRHELQKWISDVLEKFGPQKGAKELPGFLADMKPIDYDLIRKPLAEKIGVRPAALDDTRKLERRRRGEGDQKKGQGRPLELEDPEPWPEEVYGIRLAADIEACLNRYLVLPDHAATAITLWIIFTYVYDAFRVCPMLLVESPQKRCGKSTLLIMLLRACYRALPAGNISSSVLFRVIEKFSPTLIIDEADTFVRDNEEIRGLLNIGHTREMAYALRNVEVNGNHEPHTFCTWGPKAVATIGDLKDTLMDRSIVIRMRRKKQSEQRERLGEFHGQTLKERCARWAQDNRNRLPLISVDEPEELHDRAIDNWTPLFVIASCIGGEWPERARAAAIALTETDSDIDSIAVRLLADIRELLYNYPHDFISSKELASSLIGLQDRPWADFGHGKPITSTKAARMLWSFGVKVGKDTLGNRGYHVSKFHDPFDRYLPPFQSAETPKRSNDADSGDPQSAEDSESSAFSKSRKPASNKGFGTSALSHPQGRGNGHDPELMQVLAEACAGLSVTADELLAGLAPEDYVDVIADPTLARQFAESLSKGN